MTDIQSLQIQSLTLWYKINRIIRNFNPFSLLSITIQYTHLEASLSYTENIQNQNTFHVSRQTHYFWKTFWILNPYISRQ